MNPYPGKYGCGTGKQGVYQEEGNKKDPATYSRILFYAVSVLIVGEVHWHHPIP